MRAAVRGMAILRADADLLGFAPDGVNQGERRRERDLDLHQPLCRTIDRARFRVGKMEKGDPDKPAVEAHWKALLAQAKPSATKMKAAKKRVKALTKAVKKVTGKGEAAEAVPAPPTRGRGRAPAPSGPPPGVCPPSE